MNCIIRPETPDDHPAVGEVNRLAFGGDGEARLVEELRRSPRHIPELSLVAVVGDRVVGHILFSPICIRSGETGVAALALAPMAVRPEHQRRGIGSALVREGLDGCRLLGHRIVVVLGHAEYYPRFGFAPARANGIHPPFEVPDDVFMVCELVPGALRGVGGTVEYPPAFSAV